MNNLNPNIPVTHDFDDYDIPEENTQFIPQWEIAEEDDELDVQWEAQEAERIKAEQEAEERFNRAQELAQSAKAPTNSSNISSPGGERETRTGELVQATPEQVNPPRSEMSKQLPQTDLDFAPGGTPAAGGERETRTGDEELGDAELKESPKISREQATTTKQALTIESRVAPWWDGRKLDEVMFAEGFVRQHPLQCVNGCFFSTDGKLASDEPLRNLVYNEIKPFVKSSIPSRVGTIIETIKRECSVEKLSGDSFIIHLANGTYDIRHGFSPEKQVCRYRLPVSYNPDAPVPRSFYMFINDLFYPEDLDAVQEYIGYCLLPITTGQKMMLIIGRGGEGKSTFGSVLSALFGQAATNSSIHSLEESRFNVAELEDKLLMIDDDLKLDALPSTNKLKTIVTAIDPIQVERKGIQPYLAKLFCRIIGFGNYTLECFSDSSVGFFRRQIILKTKLPPRNRVNKPYLFNELKEELEGILLWAINGLERLIQNNMQFSISERAKNTLAEVMLEANNIPDFIMSDALEHGEDYSMSSTELYNCYSRWCERNGEDIIQRKKFIKFLKDSGERFKVAYNKNVPINNARVRGFTGIKASA